VTTAKDLYFDEGFVAGYAAGYHAAVGDAAKECLRPAPALGTYAHASKLRKLCAKRVLDLLKRDYGKHWETVRSEVVEEAIGIVRRQRQFWPPFDGGRVIFDRVAKAIEEHFKEKSSCP